MDIQDEGTGNSYRFDANAFDAGASLTINGDDNTIEIGPGVDARAPKITIEGDGNIIRLGVGRIAETTPSDIPTRPFLLHHNERAPVIDILGDRNTIISGGPVQIYDSIIQMVGDANTMRIGSWVRAHLRVDFASRNFKRRWGSTKRVRPCALC